MDGSGDGADTIKRGRKFDQVVDGARQVFMTDGYEGASVDTIAKAAGVSKATLYSYFSDKRLLFMEVAQRECAVQANRAIDRIEEDGSPREVLCEAAGHMVRFFLSHFGRQVYRICVAESDRFPEIGQKFYESGPMVVRTMLMEYLSEAVDRGELAIDDIELAADQFPELCKASLHIPLVLGIKSEFTDAEIDRVISGAVDMFLARYGVDGAT
ncbi:TetR/AcrR family transcriptional regulator [Rhodobacteraceae bacterium CCMM004]|nr:TetR/AcrR family transcriptional regulator [Rhodobacteraceae bacterium CCMM004]